MAELAEYEKEGLLELSPQWISVTPKGAYAHPQYLHGIRQISAHPAGTCALFQGNIGAEKTG